MWFLPPQALCSSRSSGSSSSAALAGLQEALAAQLAATNALLRKQAGSGDAVGILLSGSSGDPAGGIQAGAEGAAATETLRRELVRNPQRFSATIRRNAESGV